MTNAVKGYLRVVALFAFVFTYVSITSAQSTQPTAVGSLEDLRVPAPSPAGNLLGDPTTQRVLVYLPPSYKRETAKRYPTLYLARWTRLD